MKCPPTLLLPFLLLGTCPMLARSQTSCQLGTEHPLWRKRYKQKTAREPSESSCRFPALGDPGDPGDQAGPHEEGIAGDRRGPRP